MGSRRREVEDDRGRRGTKRIRREPLPAGEEFKALQREELMLLAGEARLRRARLRQAGVARQTRI